MELSLIKRWLCLVFSYSSFFFFYSLKLKKKLVNLIVASFVFNIDLVKERKREKEKKTANILSIVPPSVTEINQVSVGSYCLKRQIKLFF